MTDDQAQKPDATPSSFSMDRHIELINAYEDSLASNRALKARIAELERQLQFTNSNWPHEKKLHAELASVRQEIERWRKQADEVFDKRTAERRDLTQAQTEIERLKLCEKNLIENWGEANARIKELEDQDEYRINQNLKAANRNINDENKRIYKMLEEAEEREQKLVSVLNAVDGAMTNGDLEFAQTALRIALKEHKGET